MWEALCGKRTKQPVALAVLFLSYLLRIGDFKQYAGKTILNNVYMDLRGKKPVFKRTKTVMERNNIFATIRRYHVYEYDAKEHELFRSDRAGERAKQKEENRIRIILREICHQA